MTQNILMLSTTVWESPWWFRRQHFARCLARNGWRVLYVNPQQSMARVFLGGGLAALRAAENRSRIYSADGLSNLRIGRPPLATPYFVRSAPGSVLNRLLLRRHLRRVASREFGGEDYTQVFYNPCDVRVVDPQLPSIYDIVDKFDAYPEYEHMQSYVNGCHRRACAVSRAMVVTAPSLIPEGWASKCTVISNGVDLPLFRDAKARPCPADLAGIPAPRAVYAGALLEWFDYDLLGKVARLLPHVHFVVIGFPEFKAEGMPANVRYLGKKRQDELPAYYGHCQAGIIPFRVNPLTVHVNPLKFYEYLAADIPCVSSPMHPIESFVERGVLALSDNPESFAGALLDHWKEADKAGAREARAQIANEHDWAQLALQFMKVLQSSGGHS